MIAREALLDVAKYGLPASSEKKKVKKYDRDLSCI